MGIFHIFIKIKENSLNYKFMEENGSFFWQNVIDLLEKQEKSRKELAQYAHFDVSNIGKGLKSNNIPNAETAVLIANFLHTSVEFLVTGKDTNFKLIEQEGLYHLHKYSRIINDLDNIPEPAISSLEMLIHDLSQKEYGKK